MFGFVLSMNKTISLKNLTKLYVKEGKSISEISKLLGYSENKINYWVDKYRISKRSISEALYLKHNPQGDPFEFMAPSRAEEWFLFGLGLGLYWGEGNKKNKTQVRLGNTDPHLIKSFLRFVDKVYKVEKRKIRFGLQIFSDMSPRQALSFWSTFLEVSPKQFGKVIVTPARSIGTYRQKTKHGVLTIYISNSKLRNILCDEIEKLSQVS